MADATFFWHDYETFGTDPRRDRPSQFAGIRTNMELEPVDDPVSIFCQPPTDALPHPQACLITGIMPQQAQRDGLPEHAFAAAVHEQLAQPGTCGVGYNSLRFDDEFTRHLLYRNFFDPYEREWKHGNARWDLIDLARMCHALRPEGIQWPRRDDGSPSFKLEHLAAANHIEQRRAHDAVSDVEALIGLARLIRNRQPRLWQWYLALRRKQRVFGLLDVGNGTPMLHVSSRYPASRGCLAMIMPLAMHPLRPNEIIVLDLDHDPTDLLDLDAEAIADRIFTARADLPEGIERIPLRTVHANRSPALAPLSVLKGVDTARIALDVERCQHHAAQLRQAPHLAATVREVFTRHADLPAAGDPELALYDGFLPNADRPLLARVRGTPPEQLAHPSFSFSDPRYAELLLRYRARNWPHTLDPEEHVRWGTLRSRRLTGATDTATLSLADYFAILTTLRAAPGTDRPSGQILDQLEHWGRELAAAAGIDIDFMEAPCIPSI